MTTNDKNKTKLRPLPANLMETDLTGLQNLHSEMLATCSDIGFEPPSDTLVEITGVSQGLPVVGRLHAAIAEHLEKPLAEDEGKKDDGASAEKPAPKKKKTKDKKSSQSETPQEAMARQKKARLARDATKPADAGAPAQKPEKEKTVAKKAKKASKKAASASARTRVDETKKISWLLKERDLGARDGSERAERRKKLKSASGKTVGAYLKAGGSVATLNRAVADKVVKVS